MDDIERDLLGTNRDPTVAEAENIDEIVRCAGCGFWILEGDDDEEGFCADCQDARDEGRI